MMIRRVVFDTSTLISAALRPDSIPHQALVQAFRFCDVCASRATLEELRKVLLRAKFRRYLPDEVRQQFVRMMENNVRLVVVREMEGLSGSSACRDSDDNKFLGLAFEAEAEAIVSSDEDLLVLHPWNGIRILRAAEFLKEVGSCPSERCD